MSNPTPIGPFLACGLADAYGAGFEFTSAPYVKKHNRMAEYIPHPKFAQRPANCYTDDTQMALGMGEYLLLDDPQTALAMADRWVKGFKRDQRTGYSQGFYDILTKVSTGSELLATLIPNSTKNGGAMRAFPCGYLSDPAQVRDLAMWQASITHGSWRGMTAAAASALMFHYFYHRLGPKIAAVSFLSSWLPGTDWTVQTLKQTTATGVQTDGLDTVRAAVHCVINGQSLTDVVQMAVALRGDTDTVAAIAAASASVCTDIRNAFPSALVAGLENGTYGRDYLINTDAAMDAKFPPNWRFPVALEAPKPTKVSRANNKKYVDKGPTKPVDIGPRVDEGPIDFLFDED